MVSRKGRDWILGRQKQQIVSHSAIKNKNKKKKENKTKNNHTDKFQRGYLVVVGKLNYVK